MIPDRDINRREFFRNLARGGMLLGLGALGGALAWRRSQTGAPVSSCLNHEDCGACGAWGRCSLPPKERFITRGGKGGDHV
ncbi:hypothetical protein JXA32_07755 [Candidatus Sumerlaeota bacterium]|nr:hypothetical protein [Candidatus Sumerlaeota bacterium]